MAVQHKHIHAAEHAPGGIDQIQSLVLAGHSAFGNDASVDPGPISGVLNYGLQSTVLTVADDWTVASPPEGLLLSGVYSYAEFSRNTPFGAGEGDPAMVAVIGKTTWAAGAGATGSNDSPGVMHGGFFAVQAESTDTLLSFAVGTEGTIYVMAGAGMTYGGTAVKASGAYLGSASDPGDFVGLDAHLYSQRTGGNYDVTMATLFWHPSSTGIPANLYGLRIGPMLAALGSNYNILSEGATSKNKFEGTLYFGESGDVNLYRGSADVLATDDSFHVGNALSVNGGSSANADFVVGENNLFALLRVNTLWELFDTDTLNFNHIRGGSLPWVFYQNSVEAMRFFGSATPHVKIANRLIQGTPNSAPADADLDNGMVSAYLDQSADKLKFRVRYSDGTLKTGEVALA